MTPGIDDKIFRIGENETLRVQKLNLVLAYLRAAMRLKAPFVVRPPAVQGSTITVAAGDTLVTIAGASALSAFKVGQYITFSPGTPSEETRQCLSYGSETTAYFQTFSNAHTDAKWAYADDIDEFEITQGGRTRLSGAFVERDTLADFSYVPLKIFDNGSNVVSLTGIKFHPVWRVAGTGLATLIASESSTHIRREQAGRTAAIGSYRSLTVESLNAANWDNAIVPTNRSCVDKLFFHIAGNPVNYSFPDIAITRRTVENNSGAVAVFYDDVFHNLWLQGGATVGHFLGKVYYGTQSATLRTLFAASDTYGDAPASSHFIWNNTTLATYLGGAFGCNGATPQTAVTLPANATDLATAITLVNAMKAALIANGIAA